jgi:prevent-host-death family protein
MATVGIRELKNRLSDLVRRAANGERITVTDRGRPVAILSAPIMTPEDERIAAMLREGIARWGGGKPRGSRRPIRIKGGPISQTVIEDRR